MHAGLAIERQEIAISRREPRRRALTSAEIALSGANDGSLRRRQAISLLAAAAI
jgi:hypothetical protein